jgi:hypothetical protein
LQSESKVSNQCEGEFQATDSLCISKERFFSARKDFNFVLFQMEVELQMKVGLVYVYVITLPPLKICQILNHLHGNGYILYEILVEILKESGADVLHSCPYEVSQQNFCANFPPVFDSLHSSGISHEKLHSSAKPNRLLPPRKRLQTSD